MKKIIGYTDGACSGNPGVGGYAGIMICKGQERVIYGCSSEVTTNNRMELTAVVELINWLNKVQKEPCEIEIRTDSQYIIDCQAHKTKAWFANRPNHDLWFQLIEAGVKGKHRIRFVKVKGHSGDEYNEKCDKLAKEQCIRAKHGLLKTC